MKICYVVYIWMFLTEIRVSLTDEIEMHGYSGKYVIISCHFMEASNNVKYFCRDPCNDEDILVSSDRSPNRRFRLEDSGTGTFTVTITDLQESDSGIYWCGVERVGIDTYHKVNLRVSKESSFATTSRTSGKSNPDDNTTSSSVTEQHQSNLNVTLHAIGGLILVIVLLCLLVAVYKHRKRVKKSASFCLDIISNKSFKHNERRAEEADKVHDKDLQDSQNKKSKKLKLKVPKSNELLVYQNLLFNTGQSDVIYEI
ncbi:uncharacterized protein [Paramisgurnus dabryanus]|uniref:uncharacterized protein n=1 Tax=Paramisgurnus dabryanus TaxID=90735 RepID=UPI003CCF758D